jgi:hypothetical protein
MAIFKSLRKMIRKILYPNIKLKVYSYKTQQWVTVSVPEYRQDLIAAEISKFEAMTDIPKTPKVPKKPEPSLSAIEERNEWIRNVKVCPSLMLTLEEDQVTNLE